MKSSKGGVKSSKGGVRSSRDSARNNFQGHQILDHLLTPFEVTIQHEHASTCSVIKC